MAPIGFGLLGFGETAEEGLTYAASVQHLPYFGGCDTRCRYWITPGSIVGVLLWAVASAALRGYLHFFNSYTMTYGSLGPLLFLMLWFYITGLPLLLGYHVN